MRRTVFQLFSGNLLSKGLGFAREILTAALFGTGAEIAAYRVAQTGTLVPVNFFTSDSLNSAFVPRYKDLLTSSRDRAQTLFWALAAIFALLAVALSVGLSSSAGCWVALLAPGLATNTAATAVTMLGVMAAGVPCYVLSALLMFLAMANNDYVPMAVRPSIQNIGLVSGVVLAFIFHSPVILAWGFTVAYVVFGAWVLTRVVLSGILAFPERWLWSTVRDVLVTFWATLRPLIFLPVLLQGNIAIERAVASLVSAAAVAGIDYAKFITETLIILVAMPVAFAGLGHWSGLSQSELNTRLKTVIHSVSLLSIPVSVFLAMNAHLVIEALYARGVFDANSVVVTSRILLGMAFGLWAQVLGYILLRALNAQLKNKTVLRVMAFALLANAAFNLVAYRWLGAVTLGVGNSLYGTALLGGTLYGLGLVREAADYIKVFVVPVAGYVLLYQWFPVLSSVWSAMALSVSATLFYWLIWFVLLPSLRRTLLGLVEPARVVFKR